jgi:predicted sulfurtransferase
MIVKYTTVVAAVLMHTYVICAMAGMQLHQDISTKQADSVIRNSKNVVVLDVRTPEEYRLGHLQTVSFTTVQTHCPRKLQFLYTAAADAEVRTQLKS